MTRAEVLQEVRLMKFEEVYTRRTAGKLTQEQAAEILGVSVRTVRRWEDRYEADGAEGLYDRRLGKLANNRVPTDTAMEMLTLFDSKYWDYSPKHFHEKLVTRHGFTRSYNWERLTLQSHGRVQSAPRTRITGERAATPNLPDALRPRVADLPAASSATEAAFDRARQQAEGLAA